MTLESKSDITNAAEPSREEELLASKMTHTPVRKTRRRLKVAWRPSSRPFSSVP